MAVADTIAPFVIREPGVPLEVWDDGSVRVGGTRLTLDAVVESYLAGQSATEIAENYGPTPESVIRGAVAYYSAHMAEVDQYLKRRSAAAAEFWEKRERDPRIAGLGHRLRERKAERDAAADS